MFALFHTISLMRVVVGTVEKNKIRGERERKGQVDIYKCILFLLFGGCGPFGTRLYRETHLAVTRQQLTHIRHSLSPNSGLKGPCRDWFCSPSTLFFGTRQSAWPVSQMHSFTQIIPAVPSYFIHYHFKRESEKLTMLFIPSKQLQQPDLPFCVLPFYIEAKTIPRLGS
jgi:hypothetical protein